jgi:hypothetical protein
MTEVSAEGILDKGFVKMSAVLILTDKPKIQLHTLLITTKLKIGYTTYCMVTKDLHDFPQCLR